MNPEPSEKYRQLALFSVIVAEVVVTPSALGALAYFLFKNQDLRLVYTSIAAGVGLAVAFYRISLINKRAGKKA